MKHHQEAMGEELPKKIKTNRKIPWNDASFKIDDHSLMAGENKSEMFHTISIKGMFLVKRAISDLKPGFRFFMSRAKSSMQQDW